MILLIFLFFGYKSLTILKKNYSQNHKIAKKHSLILFDSISTRVINDFYFISYLYTINDYFLFKEDKQVKARFLNKLSEIDKTYDHIISLSLIKNNKVNFHKTQPKSMIHYF